MVEVRGFKEGLEDVVAAESGICFIDGDRGILSYRGIDIHQLADSSTFEEVCFLLWEGRLPRAGELAALRARIGAERAVSREILGLLDSLARRTTPMEALRTAVSALAEADPDVHDMSPEANRRKAVRLTAQLATCVAAIHRFRQGRPMIPPDSGRAHADDFLRMLNGETARSAAVRALDIALVLHADHELNASTFAARVTASTLADIYAAVTSACATLKGPLHGGANEESMRMLAEIKTPDRAEKWLKEKLAKKAKIMGFGHRVYKKGDSRVPIMRELGRELGERVGKEQWIPICEKLEETMEREKQLCANVDLYAAPVFSMFGLDPALNTPIFAASRISGWCAHVVEQHDHNRLIRPRSLYTGPQLRAYPATPAR